MHPRNNLLLITFRLSISKEKGFPLGRRDEDYSSPSWYQWPAFQGLFYYER
jgi:hypothetical protein